MEMELTAITSYSDQQKIFKERTGNDFEHYYNKYYNKLIYYTNKMCNDIQKAEDITTDSFLVALEKIDKYEKDKAQFSTWLFTIAKNLTLQEIKIQKKTISIDTEIDEEGTTLKDFIQEEENKEYLTDISAKKAEIIKQHMTKLKEPYRNVLHMREIQKMPYKDIADKLNKNLSTIKSQIRGGRAILKSQTKKEFDMLDDMYS
jgi:RNA polymerase sigma-70 factor (ECF subfamily)